MTFSIKLFCPFELPLFVGLVAVRKKAPGPLFRFNNSLVNITLGLRHRVGSQSACKSHMNANEQLIEQEPEKHGRGAPREPRGSNTRAFDDPA